MTEITFGSLFAGVGGFDLGFERSGMVCKWQVEIDDYATKVLEKHWPNVDRFRDIRDCGKHNLQPVDVICGGFPCQDISYAGNGAGLNGARSGLFFELVRVVREMGPRVIVLENVAALLTRGIHDVLGTLASLGFDAEWHCLPAASVGAPHIRDRVFIVGTARRDVADTNGVAGGKEGSGLRPETPRWWGQRTGPANVCDHVANATGNGRNEGQPNGCGCEAGTGAWPEYRLGCGGGWWETEPGMGRVVDGLPNRVDRLRGLGNAVVPQVAEWIGARIMEQFE